MPTTSEDLYTVVKNVSGKSMAFGFLGAHGKTLANNATYTVPGDLVTKLGAQRSQRKFKALERALTNNMLDIVKSPSVYVLSGSAVREVAVNASGVLGTTNPSWQGSGATDFSANVGPTGPAGATGPAGSTGPAGATGATGPGV